MHMAICDEVPMGKTVNSFAKVNCSSSSNIAIINGPLSMALSQSWIILMSVVWEIYSLWNPEKNENTMTAGFHDSFQTFFTRHECTHRSVIVLRNRSFFKSADISAKFKQVRNTHTFLFHHFVQTFTSIWRQALLSNISGPLFTKWPVILPQDLVKPWSHEIWYQHDHNTLKFDRHLARRCYRGACQSSERLENAEPESRGFTRSCGKTTIRLEKSEPESRGFETSRDLAVRRPLA